MEDRYLNVVYQPDNVSLEHTPSLYGDTFTDRPGAFDGIGKRSG